MKFSHPLPLAVLWVGSLVLTVAATRVWFQPGGVDHQDGALGFTGNPASESGTPGARGTIQDAPDATRRALSERDPLARAAGIAAILPQLSGQNALGVLDAYLETKKANGTGLATEGGLVLLQVGRTAGRAALERERPQDPASPKVPAQFDLVMRGFAGTDPDGALTYWKSLPGGPFKNSLKSGLLNGLADNNTALARDFFASLPPAEQISQIPHLPIKSTGRKETMRCSSGSIALQMTRSTPQ